VLKRHRKRRRTMAGLLRLLIVLSATHRPLGTTTR
jgi:hypothetical protein